MTAPCPAAATHKLPTWLQPTTFTQDAVWLFVAASVLHVPQLWLPKLPFFAVFGTADCRFVH